MLQQPATQKCAKQIFVPFLSFQASQVVWAGVGRQKVAPKTQNLVHFIFIRWNISSVLSDPRRSLICLQYLTMLSPVACPRSPNNCLLLQRSYDWNYNLNRHLKYECGKENAFMCSKCGRRFPHKQNCVYHLKRKHKIVCETIDQYVSAGLVVFQGSSVGSQGTSETSPAGEQQQPGNASNIKDQVASLQTKYEEMKDQHTSNGSGMKLESSVSPPPNSASS